jgi:hypothetical protein
LITGKQEKYVASSRYFDMKDLRQETEEKAAQDTAHLSHGESKTQ